MIIEMPIQNIYFYIHKESDIIYRINYFFSSKTIRNVLNAFLIFRFSDGDLHFLNVPLHMEERSRNDLVLLFYFQSLSNQPNQSRYLLTLIYNLTFNILHMILRNWLQPLSWFNFKIYWYSPKKKRIVH